MIVVWTIGLAILTLSGVTAFHFARRHAWRWGEVPASPAVQAGAGAYRQIALQPMRARGTPAVVPWSAGTGFVWAALTMLVFVPGGLLLTVIVSEASSPWGVLGSASVIAICASGFALAIGMITSGLGLLRCRPHAARKARRVAIWSILHHVAVLATMIAIDAVRGDDAVLVSMAIVPCILGGLHALALHAAGSVREPAEINDEIF